jgi:hypothetical protein
LTDDQGPAGRAAAALLAAVLLLACGGLLLHERVPRVGAQTGVSVGGGFTQLPQEEVERDLDAVRASGAAWVRLDVNWALVEQERGERRWADVDRVVAAAAERDLSVLGLLAYTPAWARPDCPSDKCPPQAAGEFAAFARAAAARYSTRQIAAWEVWNEPNIPSFWAPAPDVERYGRLLQLTARAVRQERPGATIVSAGLAPAAGDGDGIAPVEYLERLYRTGAMAAVDAVGWHPYSAKALPLEPGTEAWNTFLQMEQARRVMTANGDADATVWATEFGVSTGDDERAVSPDRQAAVLRQGLEVLATRRWPWLEVLLVYTLRDAAESPDWQAGFGVLTHDGGRKPGFDVLQDLAGRRWRPPAEAAG